MSAGAPALRTLEEILARLDEKPTLARVTSAARQLGQLHADEPEMFTDLSVTILRNFTIEPYEPLLKVAAYRRGMHLDLRYSGYEPAAPDTLAALADDAPDAVIVAVRLEELAPALTEDFLGPERGRAPALADDAVDFLVSLVQGVWERTGASVLVHNFVTPHVPALGLADAQDAHGQVNLVRAMNVQLAERIARMEAAHILDLDLCFARVGLLECADDRGARMSDAPLTQSALRALADAHVRHLRALRGPQIKCLVVDCDNTLWNGVIGEDGPTGIALGHDGAGRRHHELQRDLANLHKRGVVLAICSKNEQADVLGVLRDHPDCVLRESDFAAMRINWLDKATNIEEIAAELNLSLGHLAFLDDNPVECEWVRERLPEVRVVQWPTDLGEGGTLDDLGLFDSLLITDEDRRRTELYRAEGQRRAAREDVTSIDDYLRSLEMVATVGLATPEQLPRIAQLVQRTNQFNLTTRRHDAGAIDAMQRDPDTEIVWLDLRDRFGASGLVGCGILRVDGGDAIIDTLLISCRVIGRGVESVLVNRLAQLARGHAASRLVGEYIPSARNEQVAELYTRLGFTASTASDEAQRWRWDLAQGTPAAPDWIEIVEADGSGT